MRSDRYVVACLFIMSAFTGRLHAGSCGTRPAEGTPAQLSYAQCDIANRNWEEAEQQIRAFRSHHPDSKDAAIVEADLLIVTHRLEDAEPLLDQLLHGYPKSVQVLTLYAEFSEKLGRWAEAEPYLRKAADLSPNNPEVWKRLADLYVAKKPKDAVRCFQKAVALSPNDPVALAGLAGAYKQADQPDNAKAIFARAMEVNRRTKPPSAIADYLYGQYLADEQQFRQSTLQYNLAIQEDPTLSDVYFARAQALIELREWAAAKRDLQRTIQIPGHELPSLSMMVRACRGLGEMDEANLWAQRLAAASRQHDNQRVAGNEIAGQMQNANALMKQRKFDEAAIAYQRLTDSHPEASQAWLQLGRCYMVLGKPADAAADFRKAIALDNSSTQGFALLGQSLLRQGRITDARSEFASALHIEPLNLDATIGFAACDILDKRYAAAIQRLHEAQSRNPASPDLSLMLAEALYKNGRCDAALREVTQLLKSDPQNQAGRRMLAALTKQSPEPAN